MAAKKITDPIFKMNIADTPKNVIQVPIPDTKKSVSLRPLWTINDSTTTGDHGAKVNSPFITKLEHFMDDINSNIEEFFLKSEKYNGTSKDFQKDIKSSLKSIQREYINTLRQ